MIVSNVKIQLETKQNHRQSFYSIEKNFIHDWKKRKSENKSVFNWNYHYCHVNFTNKFRWILMIIVKQIMKFIIINNNFSASIWLSSCSIQKLANKINKNKQKTNMIFGWMLRLLSNIIIIHSFIHLLIHSMKQKRKTNSKTIEQQQHSFTSIIISLFFPLFNVFDELILPLCNDQIIIYSLNYHYYYKLINYACIDSISFVFFLNRYCNFCETIVMLKQYANFTSFNFIFFLIFFFVLFVMLQTLDNWNKFFLLFLL